MDEEAPMIVERPAPTEAVETVGCPQLFDPCSREPIPDNNLEFLEKRVREIKKSNILSLNPVNKFPEDIKNREQLLLWLLNRPTPPDIDILNYEQSGQLYESYWDIVFALGLMPEFPITKKFYLYSGKVEELTSLEDSHFTKDSLKYLSQRKINQGSKTGASDITICYKSQKNTIYDDPCSTSTIDQTKGQPRFILCSSKWYKVDSNKGIDKFDIQNIYTAAKKLNKEYECIIILLVKDRKAVEEKLRKAMRRYISEEASRVFGIDDLLLALNKLYTFFHERVSGGEITSADILTIYPQEKVKSLLELRLHQYLTVYKITDGIKKFQESHSGNNRFLVGIVPRGGKTYIAGGIIDLLRPSRVAVILGAKSETISQFKELFADDFVNFNDYEVVDVLKAERNFIIHPDKKYIFIMSNELFKDETTSRSILRELKDGKNKADLFICDEGHLKQTKRTEASMEKVTRSVRSPVPAAATPTRSVSTDEIDEEELVAQAEDTSQEVIEGIVDEYIGNSVPAIYLTGTYRKPLDLYKIPADNVVLWDYQEIQRAKDLSTNEEYFRENFGEYYDRALLKCFENGLTYESIEKDYRKFPELYLITTVFTDEAKNIFSRQEKAGVPEITHLFELKKDFDPAKIHPDQWHTGFRNTGGMMRLINYLSPLHGRPIANANGKEIEPIGSALRSIDHIAQRIGDRLAFFTSTFIPHTQLWFLPKVRGHPLKKRICALAGAIFKSEWFRKHFVILAVSGSDFKDTRSAHNSKDNKIFIHSDGIFTWDEQKPNTTLKQRILDIESEARKEGKGLIILAQEMLQLGISLACVSIVVQLDNTENVDERIQKMYRALTESINKKGGFIVDLNYFRTVTALMTYQITAAETRKKRKMLKEDIPNLFNEILDVYSIDDDKPILREEIKNKSVPELERILGSSKATYESIELGTAASAINKNVGCIIEILYNSNFDEILTGMAEEHTRRTRILVREEGTNLTRAEHPDEPDEELDRNEVSRVEADMRTMFPDSYEDKGKTRKILTDDEKRKSVKNIFNTALKAAAFGTNSMTIGEYEKLLESDAEMRENLYDLLIRRGEIKPHPMGEEYVIDALIRPGLRALVEQSKNQSYIRMKESVEDTSKYPKQVVEVLHYIRDNLTPKKAEMHEYGEVFTPMEVVRDMLDTLPAEVWNNTDLKWLDPANGMGNYPIEVYLRLFYGFRTKDGKYVGYGKDGIKDGEKFNSGLTEAIKSDDRRSAHIIKNMLYMVEINLNNVNISKKLFGKLATGIKPNIIQHHKTEGFLADKPLDFPNGSVNEFDIIIGNPPFNKGTILRKHTVKIRANIKEMGLEGKKREALWPKFVLKIFSEKIIKKDGYLLFITPINWFHPEISGVRDILLSKQIHFIKIFSLYQSEEKFGGKGKLATAYYLIQNKEPTDKTTTIDDILSNRVNIKLSSKSIIILAHNSIYNKVCNKSKLFMDTDSIKSTAVKRCEPGSHKQIIGIYNDGVIKFIKTNEKHPLTDIPKIIINGYTFPRYFYDKAGEYGKYSKDGTNYIIVGDDLDKIKSYFDTKLSALLLNYIKFTQEKIDPKYFPDVRTIPLDKITDENLADYFKFTEDEIAIINSTEYPKREYKFKEITCDEVKKDSSSSTRSKKRTTRKRGRTFF